MNIKTSLVLIAALVGTSLANAGEYLVKYKNAQALNNIAAMQTEAFGMQVTGMHKPGQLVKVVIGQQNEAKTLAKLMTDKNIQYVVPNIKIRAFEAPVDPVALKEQYALAKVNAAAAWAKAGNKGSRNVLLAVIDTGVDYKHKNLAPNTVPGYDFRDNDADPMDLTGQQNPGHGTHCAGIIGASGLIDGGIQGLSPEVSIMPIRFLGADGSGELEGGIKSIDYAIEHKVQVISASWGASVPLSTAQPLVEAIARAEKAGIIFVAAAANDGKNNDTTEVYPANANVSNMITVAASNSSDAKPSWSNYGKAKVHVAAPGDAIMSTLPGDKYGNLSGTSMATPLVAGLVAFLKAQDASLTAQEIRALLQTTGAKVNIETACNCRVDALAAVTTLIDKKAWLVPTAGSLAANQTVQVTLKNGVATSFTSSNPAVLTVDEKGLITGVANGSATITATDAAGVATTSLNFYVGRAQSTPP
ncbi:MAG: S8 family serine peptidase, partial [Bdellovibrionaceae bacterium]|nr:S8 family serine peptidase [Pseudobdellovibrionaceae bacterium]